MTLIDTPSQPKRNNMKTQQLLLTALLAAALSPAMAEEADPAQEARR